MIGDIGYIGRALGEADARVLSATRRVGGGDIISGDGQVLDAVRFFGSNPSVLQ